MLLSARMLKDVASVNSFESDSQLSWMEGDTVTIYFQLVDISLDRPDQGFSPAGRRYVPASGATLSCRFENVDDDVELSRFATQPFANDGSIWSVSILSTDLLRGTPQLRLSLTQSTVVTRGLVKNAIKIHSQEND